MIKVKALLVALYIRLVYCYSRLIGKKMMLGQEDEILFLSEEIIEKVDGKNCEWFKPRMIANLKTGEIRTFPLNVETKGI